MKKLIKFIILVSCKLSLILMPPLIVGKWDLLINTILSARFKLLTKNGERVFLFRPFYILGHKYIKYKSFTSSSGLRIECIDSYLNQTFAPSLTIGENVSFNYRCHIGVINEVSIGNNVLIGSNVLITDHFHGYNNEMDVYIAPRKRNLISKGKVVISDNVWIGENVCILPNVTIGEGSVIGANSVVNRDIPPYSIAAGNPAIVVRKIR